MAIQANYILHDLIHPSTSHTALHCAEYAGKMKEIHIKELETHVEQTRSKVPSKGERHLMEGRVNESNERYEGEAMKAF